MSDLIGRQAAIDQIECLMDDKTKVHYNHGCADAIATLNNLPSAQQWIPVSERLPDEDASVLASIKNHSFEVAVGEIDGEVFWIVDGFIPLDDVIAWMPLPEPFKEVG